jgi:hypothetical protein
MRTLSWQRGPSERPEVPRTGFVACVAALLLQPSLALTANAPCDLNELPLVTHENPFEFARDGYPWRITADQLAGTVRVDRVDKYTSCSIGLGGVRRVYGGTRVLALRSIEIASDDLYFFDLRTCTEVRKAVHFGVSRGSEVSTAARLRKMRICDLSERSGTKGSTDTVSIGSTQTLLRVSPG